MIQIRRRTAAIAVLALVVATASLVVTLTRTAGAGGNTFNDTPPWIADHANWLATNGIANGYPDGTFRPNQDITRGQAAFWMGNYNDAITLETTAANPPAAATFELEAACPAGKRAVAGGGFAGGSDILVTNSAPSGNVTDNPTGWTVKWETDDNAAVDPSVSVAFATCVPATIP